MDTHQVPRRSSVNAVPRRSSSKRHHRVGRFSPLATLALVVFALALLSAASHDAHRTVVWAHTNTSSVAP